MNNSDRELFQAAIDKWGYDAQEKMCIEECAELINALAKKSRGRVCKEEILTELADVSIMVDQMALCYGLEDFEHERNKKIMRLNEKVFLKK
jgi:NTP pyrophosphatase (non-canonical NTP hydrolase)